MGPDDLNSSGGGLEPNLFDLIDFRRADLDFEVGISDIRDRFSGNDISQLI